MQKLWDKICEIDTCRKILRPPYIDVTLISGKHRHYCSDECRLKHSEKNVKDIKYVAE